MKPNYTLNGRYRIIRSLGEGGMANVYLARDLILDRDVSVKLLRLDLRDDPQTVKRFQREALAATELVHPNIVSVYDVGEENGMQYLVMEYVEGMDLKAYIKQHFPIPYQEVINIMEQVLSAVEVAHEHNIIHRDLKPQNILIDQHGNAKITDFGIAVALSEHTLTQTNTVLGSVHYLSPEQARGGMATKRSDIYSLGIILYELLTGTVPFKGETAVSIAIKHFQSEVPSVREFDPRIPQALENVVLKATTKRPENRYGTVQEMAEDLETSLSPRRASEPRYSPDAEDDGETKVLDKAALMAPESQAETVSEPADKSGNKKKKRPKRWWLKWVIGALGVLLVFLGIALWLGSRQSVSVPDVSGMNLSSAQQSIKGANLKVGEIQRQNSSSVKKNRVIKTNPEADESVKEDASIDIFVSSGPKMLTLDNYVGQSYTKAAAELRAQGVTVKKQNQSSSDVPTGTVMSQSLESGSKVEPKKATITFTVSAGQRSVELADLVGRTKSDVQAYASEQSLNVSFNYQYSDKDKDTVIDQSPAAGSIVKEGTSITVTLSRGKQQMTLDQFNVSVEIPFSSKSSESSSESDSESDSSSSSSDTLTNTIQIYIRDKDHDYTTVYKQLTIAQNATVTLPFSVAAGKSGGYRILRDGQVIMSDNHVTKNSH